MPRLPDACADIIVGGAVFGAAGFAVYSGLKKDPVPCSLCQGTGGVRCFACGGDGRTASAASSRDELYDGTPGPGPAPRQRDMLGRSVDPRECRVCNGVGLVPCSQCRGSGFQGTF
ncbi:hypothetical protein HYH03_006985 [Edaphochlamys debaryana]|uniref:Uncharacterized protein n=1 Tax=Edaphochlamys debaryana TaxID=47281 RepID=A0A835Y4T5_9CHLO|nr:hypothetical protein HYH03_006985 [Edaphochlamys debaryana]|eukprot:KAG2494738.1 hypothetical protein HYH03_006985 [Edaphochlamys debaryana]